MHRILATSAVAGLWVYARPSHRNDLPVRRPLFFHLATGAIWLLLLASPLRAEVLLQATPGVSFAAADLFQDDSAVVCWAGGPSIECECFDDELAPTTTAFTVAAAYTNHLGVVAAAAGTKLIVFWEVAGDVYFRPYSSCGTPSGPTQTLTTFTLYDAVRLTDGNVGVAFVDADSDSEGVYLKLLDMDGATVGGPVLVNTVETGAQESPRIAPLASGGSQICFNSAPSSVKCRNFDGVPSPTTGEIVVSLQGGIQDLASDSTNGISLVTWVDATTSDYGRIISAGSLSGPEFNLPLLGYPRLAKVPALERFLAVFGNPPLYSVFRTYNVNGPAQPRQKDKAFRPFLIADPDRAVPYALAANDNTMLVVLGDFLAGRLYGEQMDVIAPSCPASPVSAGTKTLSLSGGKARLSISDSVSHEGEDRDADRIKFQWAMGDAVSDAELGGYDASTLCIWDYHAATPTLVLEQGFHPLESRDSDPVAGKGKAAFALTGRATRLAQKYKGSKIPVDGVKSFQAKSAVAGKTAVKFDLKGKNFTMPTPFSATELFDADPKVAVQVINSRGTVWTVDFSGTGDCQISANTCNSEGNCAFQATCNTP